MKHSYEEKLLNNWEDVFRQGLLTFWVFVTIKTDSLSVSEIKKGVNNLTDGMYNPTEQSLYRLLRKHYELELVDYTESPGRSGPNKKLYHLSPLGMQILVRFSRRNICLFHQKEVKLLLKKGDKK